MDDDLSADISSLIQEHDIQLVRYATALVGDGEAARDLVRATFDQYLDQRAGRGPVTDPRAWLYRRLHRLTCEQQQTDPDELTPLLADGSIDSPVARMSDEELLEYCPALGILNERDRRTFHLRVTAHCPGKAIALSLNQTVHNVAFILHNSLKRIARELPDA